MSNGFEFFRTNMPDTRQADYSLGCLEGAVFIDFDNYVNDLVCLKRISFDGYGCCDLKDKGTPMDIKDSENFRKIIDATFFDQFMLTTIIKKTLIANREFIWEDALNEYGLCE